MKLKIRSDSINYTATVVKINNLFPLDGLDNLQGTNIFGNQLILGKDVKLDDIGLFFPPEARLSDEYCKQNNLFRHPEKNKDKDKKSYIEDNGRVKAIKLRGHNSMGLFMPLSSLLFVGDFNLELGTEFNEINGFEVCRKYVRRYNKIPGTATRIKALKLVDLVDTRCTPEHIQTTNLFRNIHELNLNDNVTITEKLEGTSLRTSHNIVYRKLRFYEKVLARLGVAIQKYDYKYICASRRVIKSINFNELAGKQHFHGFDIWTEASLIFKDKLPRSYVVFSEIVGYDGQKPIQPHYTYSLNPWEFKTFVYRIAVSTPDGLLQDLPWPILVEKCKEWGVDHVPLIFDGKLIDFIAQHDPSVMLDTENWHGKLEKIIKDNYLDKPSSLCSNTWNEVCEGIVVTSIKSGIFKYWKAKSPIYLLRNSNDLDKEDFVDLEEQN